jgi:hypothetical protein
MQKVRKWTFDRVDNFETKKIHTRKKKDKDGGGGIGAPSGCRTALKVTR